MAAGLEPIATVTVLVSLLWWRLGPVNELRVALQISATIAFHRAMEMGAVGHSYPVKLDL